MEQLVDFNTAQALKEVGYNVPACAYFHRNIEHVYVLSIDYEPTNYNNSIEWGPYYTSRPTLNDAADWLRKINNLHAYLRVNEGYWSYDIQKVDTAEVVAYSHFYYKSHDEALVASISKRLEIVKEKSAKV